MVDDGSVEAGGSVVVGFLVEGVGGLMVFLVAMDRETETEREEERERERERVVFIYYYLVL